MKKKQNVIGRVNEAGMIRGTQEIQPIMIKRANSLLQDPSDSEDDGKFERYKEKK